jgi:hypothetical protein
MKKFLVLTIVLVSVISLSAQSQKTVPPPAGSGAIIQFNETSHDFGTFDEGTRATFEFEFTNTGDSNLILNNVQASCGCTVPTWPRQPIKPGEKSKIAVVYNSAGRPGSFGKSISVTTNMKKDNVKVLYIKGNVTPKPVENAQPASPVKINQN